MVRPHAARCTVALGIFTAVGFLSTDAQAQQAPAALNYETARFERHLPAVRATGPLVLDGALDETAWATAPMAQHFVQSDPREGQPATFDTEVRVLYDDDSLYFGVFAKDEEASRIIVNDLKKDYNTEGSDGFRIILDTFHDERNGYQFATNPAGAKWDAQVSNEGRETNANWDGIWEVVTRITETGWVAEIRIPFRTLKFNGAEAQTWGMNFERKVRRLNEDSFWSPIPRIYDITRVSLAGTVDGFRGLRPGRNIRVKPYALTSSNTVGRLGADGDFDAGLDVKYGVTSGLTWDFTVNTDFSQAEADEQQINLSRFSLFFPEKRDFFLENSGIFQFGAGGGGFGQGGGGDLRLFFSRRIGLSEAGASVPILAGTRLTGRQGAYSIGVLNMQQRSLGAVPAANFTALRLRRDLLANSDIGAVLLNKEVDGPGFNRVAGLDANFRFGPSVSLNAYGAKTFSSEPAVRPQGNDYTMRVAGRFDGRVWQTNGRFDTIGARFNDEMGFVPRLGVDNAFLFAGRRFRPAKISSWVREIRPHWQIDSYIRQDGGGLDSRNQDFHLPLAFQDGGSMEVGVNPNTEVVRAPFTINTSRGVQVNPGRYEFKEYFVFWNTSNAARVSFNNRYSIGRFYDGYRRSYTFGPSVRLNEHFNASLNLAVNDIELSTGSFVSKLLTTRVNYNFNTRMFVNALVQYNSDNHQWTSNLRFNVIHRPLSDFFLVYNEGRDERTGQMVSRAIIAKMTYLVAF